MRRLLHEEKSRFPYLGKVAVCFFLLFVSLSIVGCKGTGDENGKPGSSAVDPSTLSVEELADRLAEGENLMAEAQRRHKELMNSLGEVSREETQEIFRKTSRLYQGMQAYKRHRFMQAPQWRPEYEEAGEMALSKPMYSISVGHKGKIYLSDLDANAARNRKVLPMSVASDTNITILDAEGEKQGEWAIPDCWAQRVLPRKNGDVFVVGVRQMVRLDAEGNEQARISLKELLRRLDAPEGGEVPPEKEKTTVVRALGKSLLSGVRKQVPLLGEEKKVAELENQMIDGCMVADDVFVVVEKMRTQQDLFKPAPVRLLRIDADFQEVVEIENDFVRKVGKGKYLSMDEDPVVKDLVVLRREQPAVFRFNREGAGEHSWGKLHEAMPQQATEQIPPPTQLNLMQGGKLRIDEKGKIYLFTRNPATVIRRFASDGKFEGVVCFPSNQMQDGMTVGFSSSPQGDKMYVIEANPPTLRTYKQR